MIDHLLESSYRDDSNKWSNIRFGQETKELRSTEINFTHLIWSSGLRFTNTFDSFYYMLSKSEYKTECESNPMQTTLLNFAATETFISKQ